MKFKSRRAKIMSLSLAAVGFLLIAAVLSPIVTYNLTSGQFTRFLSPVPEGSFDSTKASEWFTGVSADNTTPGGVKFYTMSIPRLGIADATVSVGGEDLSQFLVQYDGTALPGKDGSTVVFGHSVLPQFYNPRDYLTIFSTLPSMRKGDMIRLEYDGVSYGYKVSEMYEVLPTQLEVLRQDVSGKNLLLITCVPPGDPRRPRRLVVKASLVPLAKDGLSSL